MLLPYHSSALYQTHSDSVRWTDYKVSGSPPCPPSLTVDLFNHHISETRQEKQRSSQQDKSRAGWLSSLRQLQLYAWEEPSRTRAWGTAEITPWCSAAGDLRSCCGMQRYLKLGYNPSYRKLIISLAWASVSPPRGEESYHHPFT